MRRPQCPSRPAPSRIWGWAGCRRTVRDTERVRECRWLLLPCLPWNGLRGWSGEEVVGQADLGAGNEGADLVRLQDERGTVGVGGLAQGDPAAGELLGFQAV